MVHLRDLAFVIICSLILYNVKLSISFLTGSTLNYEEIKNGIQKEVSHIADPIKQVEKLTGIAAQEKFIHQRTKEERDKFEAKADEYLRKANSAEKDKDKLHVELVARDTGLGFQTAIEEVERRIYPKWMFSTKLTREQRFILSLSLGITKYGRFLREKISTYPGISIFDVAKNADEYYGKLSLKLGHYQEVKTPISEAEWNATYAFVGARHYDQQQSLKLILEPLNISTDVIKKTAAGTYDYFLLLTKVDYHAMESDIENGIKTVVPHVSSVDLKIVSNYEGKRTDYVAVTFETTTYLQTEMVYELLMKYKKYPFQVKGFSVNVYCEWEKTEAFKLQTTSQSSAQSTSQSSVPAG